MRASQDTAKNVIRAILDKVDEYQFEAEAIAHVKHAADRVAEQFQTAMVQGLYESIYFGLQDKVAGAIDSAIRGVLSGDVAAVEKLVADYIAGEWLPHRQNILDAIINHAGARIRDDQMTALEKEVARLKEYERRERQRYV